MDPKLLNGCAMCTQIDDKACLMGLCITDTDCTWCSNKWYIWCCGGNFYIPADLEDILQIPDDGFLSFSLIISDTRLQTGAKENGKDSNLSQTKQQFVSLNLTDILSWFWARFTMFYHIDVKLGNIAKHTKTLEQINVFWGFRISHCVGFHRKTYKIVHGKH